MIAQNQTHTTILITLTQHHEILNIALKLDTHIGGIPLSSSLHSWTLPNPPQPPLERIIIGFLNSQKNPHHSAEIYYFGDHHDTLPVRIGPYIFTHITEETHNITKLKQTSHYLKRNTHPTPWKNIITNQEWRQWAFSRRDLPSIRQ